MSPLLQGFIQVLVALIPPGHPDVESGLPVVADPDMVSNAVQFAEGVSNPPIGMAEE